MKKKTFYIICIRTNFIYWYDRMWKEKKTTASDKFQSDYMEIGVGTTVEKGYFGVINGLLYYVDFETMNAVPICNKPDCRHISWMEDRNTKCNAANTDIWNFISL